MAREKSASKKKAPAKKSPVKTPEGSPTGGALLDALANGGGFGFPETSSVQVALDMMATARISNSSNEGTVRYLPEVDYQKIERILASLLPK